MEEVKIEKLDNKGRGICYINNKITFVPNTLKGEIVSVEITNTSKKYQEAKVINYKELSKDRVESPCPYYGKCGGCELEHMTYQDTLKFKKEKLESIFLKYANIKTNINIIPSKKEYNYRNKITLKVHKGHFGYYEEKTHKTIEINECLLAEPAINDFLKDIKHLNIKNGEVVIRSNYNNELLISMTSKDEISPNIPYLKEKHKIVGIILNNNIIDGEDRFVEIINHLVFVVSYDSFFQINRHICSELFNLIKQEINDNEIILDLYCGVGTLGIASNSSKAYGIEIVKNAILNAITNSKINKRNNIYYMLGDVGTNLPKIKDKIDTIIVDPPRTGLDKTTKQTILDFKPNKIIYVSCDPMTLTRDLKELSINYNLIKATGLDMFPYTNHIETLTVLTKRD